MGKILIKNAKVIVTCDEKDRVFRDCDMLIDGAEIIEIAKEIAADDAEVIDASGKAVYPGLIDTHAHFFQAYLRNIVAIDYSNISVPEWLIGWYQLVRFVDEDVVYYGSLTTMADKIKHGCTTAVDHTYCYTPYTGKRVLDLQVEASRMMGFRYHGARGTNTLPLSEGSQIPEDLVETTKEFIDDTKRVIRAYHDDSRYSMSRIVIAPPGPMNTLEDTFIQAVKLANETGCHLHTHLGEGENGIMQWKWGQSSVEWCRTRGFIGPNVWYAHGWEFTEDEWKLMAETGTGVTHCPTTVALGSYPVISMKHLSEMGVLLGVGTDGGASNDGANPLDSLRIAFMLQCLYSKKRGGASSAYDILKMATVNSAKIIGRDDIGSLEKGKAADLFMIDLDALELAGIAHDPKNMLVRVGLTDKVWMTMINGNVVYQDGKLVGIDEKKLSEAGDKAQEKALRIPCESYFDVD